MTSLINIALAGFLVWSGATEVAHSEVIKTQASVAPKMETISVRLTGYNAVPEQTDSTPDTTASGARSNPEVIAARSRDMVDVLPYGTVISFEAPKDATSCGFTQVEHLIGYRVIADTMHKRKTNQVDIMFEATDVVHLAGKATNPAVAVGVCEASVRVVGRIALKDIPDTQVKLALIVNKQLAVK
jgi:3D (Asp-Asp-Asp) domain-containing protein